MIELLLASVLTSSDGYWILDGIEKSRASRKDKIELKIEIINSMPDNCNRDNYEIRS